MKITIKVEAEQSDKQFYLKPSQMSKRASNFHWIHIHREAFQVVLSHIYSGSNLPKQKYTWAGSVIYGFRVEK